MSEITHAINFNTKVTLCYSISLLNGNIVESTDDEPVVFVIGDGTFAKGLEYSIFGLKPGQSQRIQIESRDAFGFRDESRIQNFSRSVFPDK